MPKLKTTQLSLAELRGDWDTVEVVEHWCPFSRRRKDLLGFADIMCVGPGAMLVQVTSRGNMAARLAKMRQMHTPIEWLESGGAIEIHGWDMVPTVKKDGTPGKRKVPRLTRWQLTTEVIGHDIVLAVVKD